MGPRKSDPNDDSGSLSVILVVILPVVQMFFFVALLILFRICYRHYCLKPKPSQSRRSMGAAVLSRNRGKPNQSTPTLRNAEELVTMAMTSSSMPTTYNKGAVASDAADGDNKGTTKASPGVLEIERSIDAPVTAVPALSTSRLAGTGSTAPSQPAGFSAATVHRSIRSSSVSPVNAVATGCSTRGVQLYSLPLSNHYQITSTSSGTCTAAVTAASAVVVPSGLIFQTIQCSKQTHSLPLSMCAVTPASASASAYQRAQILGSATLNDGIESLNSETIDSEGEEDDEEEEEEGISGQVSVELPLDRHNSHQLECIFHPQHSNSKRPTSANSTASFKCMQTY